jgi:hypothetical protein
MFSHANRVLPPLLCWLCFLSLAGTSVSQNRYNDIVLFNGRYIAVGTGGRIDCISTSGERLAIDSSCRYDLHCAFSNGRILIAAGEHGTILYSSDGRNFSRAESGTDKNIYGIACKNGLFIAGADSGMLLASKNGTTWDAIPVSIRGNIVSLSANLSFFIGVSDSGEIIKSENGMKWEIQDYNKEYAGYAMHSKFTKIAASQNSIVIIGTHDDDSPSIVISSLGNVWTEREPIYKDDRGTVQSLTAKPNGMTYDPDRDQFILACDNGELLTLPPCSKCNKYAKISETDLHALFYSENCLVIVGDGYSVFTQKLY